MNDLDLLRHGWEHPKSPSAASYQSARAALMRSVAADQTAKALRPAYPRGLRLRLLATGAAVTAAVAAAVLATALSAPSTSPSAGGQPTATVQPAPLSGPQILLAASSHALEEPVSSGTYWHIKTVNTDENGVDHPGEWWSPHNGDIYAGSIHGVVLVQWGEAYMVGAKRLTLDELEQLPTDPSALREWIADSYADPSPLIVPPGAPPPPNMASQRVDVETDDLIVYLQLIRLLWEVPASPAARAAAFTALADGPDVANLGDDLHGNWVLRLELPLPPADKYPGGVLPDGVGQLTVVIDPATSRLISTTDYQGTTRIVTTEWTNHMPAIEND